MNEYLWTFELRLLAPGGGLPEELLLPAAHCHVPREELFGGSVWLVATSETGHHLFGHARVEAIAEADRPPDTLVVITDLLRSCRFLPAEPRERASWRLPDDVAAIHGLHGCPVTLPDRLAGLVEGNKISRMNPRRIDHPGSPPGRSRSALRRRYALALRHHAFGDLRGDDRFRDLSPFSAALRVSGDHSESDLAELRRLDGLLLNGGRDDRSEGAPARPDSPAAPPAVDLLFDRFDPAEAVVRRFVTGLTHADRTSALTRMRRSEAAHRAILLDVAEFLTTEGHNPLRSRSVDLALESAEGFSFLEVKSANAHNTVVQAEAGLLQLLRYRSAARRDDLPVLDAAVIVGGDPPADVRTYLLDLGGEACVTFLYYDASKPWPDRAPGLAALAEKHAKASGFPRPP